MSELKKEGVFAFCGLITPIKPDPTNLKNFTKVSQKEGAYV